jgi:hypothetical protein
MVEQIIVFLLLKIDFRRKSVVREMKWEDIEQKILQNVYQYIWMDIYKDICIYIVKRIY